MKTVISGRIRSFDEDNRIISIYCRDRIRYFYIQRSLLNHIGKFLDLNRFVQFTIAEGTRPLDGHIVQTINYFIKIMEIRYRKNIVYYDVKNIKEGTRKLINSLDYKMFLDLEMSMHPYRQNPDFIQEIIQVGYLIVDAKDNVVATYNQVVQPTIHKRLSRRTTKFLDLTQEDIDNGIPFEAFYEHFRQVINEYDPAIIVWGRNDFLALRQGYKVNKLPSLHKHTRYINLLKLHKNYFHLKNDLGLFNALRLYEEDDNSQSHNAFEDAQVTYRIFKGFADVLNHRIRVDVSQYK